MDFNKKLKEIGEYGLIEQVRLPIVIANGLPGARMNEIVLFENGGMGIVFQLGKSTLEIMVLTNSPLKPGVKTTRTDQFLSVPVGEELLGQTVNPLGVSISSQKSFTPKMIREIDTIIPGLSDRSRITKSFSTGVGVIDLMVPLGYGQKELIIGDRKTGKTSFLLALLKNQISEGAIAVYAGIAKRKSDIKKVEAFFETENMRDKTVIVASAASDSPNLVYITPYAAMAIAEHFRDIGKNVVVVFDDLTTHAHAYREVALVANRFPGRDAYPGDIFYAHSRLLERAGNFKTKNGEVSITALPVAEVVEGDLAGYITTNLMSMTDGHIFFDGNVYFEGRRPAVNIPLSVTRVGRQTQTPLLRSINRELGAFLQLYENVQNLSHFGAELSETVKGTLSMGENVYKFFDQDYTVLLPSQVSIVIFALLWLTFIKGTNDEIEKTKNAMIEAYSIEENKVLFDEASKKQTFNELLGYVSAHKDQLLSLCKIENSSIQI